MTKGEKIGAVLALAFGVACSTAIAFKGDMPKVEREQMNLLNVDVVYQTSHKFYMQGFVPQEEFCFSVQVRGDDKLQNSCISGRLGSSGNVFSIPAGAKLPTFAQ